MIGRIRGVLLEASPPHLLLEVGGVGYEIEAPLSTFERLPKLQSEVRLYTHVAIREDTQLLFGFLTETERRLFRALIKVNGVGARTALGVLSGTSPEEFVVWVETKDLTRITRLPGIGKKTAERLIVELRDRITDWRRGVLLGGGGTGRRCVQRRKNGCDQRPRGARLQTPGGQSPRPVPRHRRPVERGHHPRRAARAIAGLATPIGDFVWFRLMVRTMTLTDCTYGILRIP